MAGVFASTILPAAGQQAEPIDPAAVGTIDPAAIIDVDSFAERAAAWADARADQWESDLVRAEALAVETKAAEEEEQERIEAEERARLEAERSRQAEEEARQAATAAPVTPTTTTTTTTTTAPPLRDTVDEAPVADDPGGDTTAAGPTAEQWHGLRQCESGNNYTAVSPSGRYRGAYQFSVPTWDWLAGTRYPSLVGVDPAEAGPGDQDKMAQALYDVYGKSPWPTCGQHLP
jgi:hypothetical protein